MSVIVGVTNKRNLVVPPIAIGGGIGPSGSVSHQVIVPGSIGTIRGNEPGGMTPVCDMNYSSQIVPNGLPGVTSVNGAAYGLTVGKYWRFAATVAEGGHAIGIINDASCPSGNPYLFRLNYYNGMPSSGSPGIQNFTSIAQTPYDTFYTSVIWRIPGPDFQFQQFGSKLFGYQRRQNDTGGFSDCEDGNGAMLVKSNFRNTYGIFNNVATKLYLPGVYDVANPNGVLSGSLVTCGVWHQMETLLVTNTVDVANGQLYIWMDGVLTHSVTNAINMKQGSDTGKFYNFHYDPVWGGGGSISKNRDDLFDIDCVFVSGKN